MKALATSLIAMFVLFAVAWSGLGSTARASDTAVAAPAGSLTVGTKNVAGKPVAGALVNVFPSGSSTPAATGLTDAAGKITFTGLAAGNYSIFASKIIYPGYAIFGSGSATVGSLPTGVSITLSSFAP